MEEKKLLMIDNFLPYLTEYLLEIYKIPLYEPEEYKRVNINTNWPGKRSYVLNLDNTLKTGYITIKR